MFADLLGGWEAVLILVVVLILFGTKHFPEIHAGWVRAFRCFREELDQTARDAGKSLAGIHGKPAAQALAPDNQAAELYDPAVFHKEQRHRRLLVRLWFRPWRRFWRMIRRFVLGRRT